MADILIRGMDKPHNCFLCDLSYLMGERLFCHITKDEVLRSKIASDCPINELPEHGDLIDRDALETDLVLWNGECGDPAFSEEAIDNAPVVIPSNKEDSRTMDEFMCGQECGNPEDGSL